MPLFDVFVGLQLPEFSKKCSVVCDAVSSAGDFWVGKGSEGCSLSWAAALDTAVAEAQDVCPEWCPAVVVHQEVLMVQQSQQAAVLNTVIICAVDWTLIKFLN